MTAATIVAVAAPATPAAILRLAAAYHGDAAARLAAKSPDILAALPARLCAVQAIELYLVAYLRAKGLPPGRIQSWRHDLSRHAQAAADLGLVLRRRTLDHLVAIAHTQEYRNLRYHPEAVTPVHVNRLTATLDELRGKVGTTVAACERTAAAAPVVAAPQGHRRRLSPGRAVQDALPCAVVEKSGRAKLRDRKPTSGERSMSP